MSKAEMVRQHLRSKKTITSWEAIQEYKVTRLADVIWQLKKRGMEIDTKMMQNSNDFRKHALYTHVYG